MSSEGKLSGKVAIITGASSGIGAATAILFSKLGASVVLVGRNEERLQKVSERCKKNIDNVLVLRADVTIEADAERIIQETIKTFSSLDILVNNAGIGETSTIEAASLAIYDNVMNTNVRSIYHLTMLATPFLIKSKGNIVNVSSICSMRSMPIGLAYHISKAALDQLTKTVAVELGPKQVRVNSVNPGVVMTELFKTVGLTDEIITEVDEGSKTNTALGRSGQPEEIAKTIAFLASDEASYITAVNLPIDAGRIAMCAMGKVNLDALNN